MLRAGASAAMRGNAAAAGRHLGAAARSFAADARSGALRQEALRRLAQLRNTRK
jgi:hypothetical protein